MAKTKKNKPLWVPMTKKEIAECVKDSAKKEARARVSFLWFCQLYLLHKFPLAFADFHRSIFKSLMGLDKFIAIIGFRGSAKSTILEAFAIWNLVTGRSNFTVYIGATEGDAKMSVANIREEIQSNQQLKEDFGLNFEEKKQGFNDKWSDAQLTIGKSTILARGRGQKVRGMKFVDARIDLIIGDDLEDVESSEKMERRKKTRQWFFTEVVPAKKQGALGDATKTVVIGNLVHRDCLLMHMKKNNPDLVNVQQFALIDEDGNISWPALYPNMAAVEAQKAEVMLAGEGMGAIIWAREYLLLLMDEDDQPVVQGDIHYYDPSWLQRVKLRGGVGVDFAISKNETADYTVFIKGVEVENDEGERRLLILKNSIRKRLNFDETIKAAQMTSAEMPERTTFFPEKVAYQEAAIETFEKHGIICHRLTPRKDKRARLIVASPHIKSGYVMFPEEGADVILQELLGFGIETHDDTVDGLVNLIIGMTGRKEAIFI